MNGLRRLIFWEFPRGTVPYDIVVLLILAFIFLTPKTWFKDQPRPREIVEMVAEQGLRVLFIEPDLIPETKPEEQWQRAVELLKSRPGRQTVLVRLEPVFDSEMEIKGYRAFVKP
jgi:hypothetical protein